jgi:SAM-dependent methyltransferase
MLEFGCAAGAYMCRLARDGWVVEGIEYSDDVAARARSLGFSVYAGSLESAPDPPEKYDMVVGWMVLEHLHDPILALRKLRSWTRPGGWLVVSVPNAGALEFRMFKDAWCALELPRHLWHFTPQTLSKVMQLGGWNIESVHHQRIMTDAWASLGNRLHDRGYPGFITRPLRRLFGDVGYLHYPLLPVAAVLASCGQTGRMTVWAKRVDDKNCSENR